MQQYKKSLVEQTRICKTSINTKRKLKIVEKCFAKYTCIEKWNVHMQDCDCVLRMVISGFYSLEQIAILLAAVGVEIEELPD